MQSIQHLSDGIFEGIPFSRHTQIQLQRESFIIKRNELHELFHSFDIISNMLVKIINLSVPMNSSTVLCVVYYLDSLKYLHSFAKFYPFWKFLKIKLKYVWGVCFFCLKEKKIPCVSVKEHQTINCIRRNYYLYNYAGVQNLYIYSSIYVLATSVLNLHTLTDTFY